MRHVVIDGRKIGSAHPCFIIAEAGVNHNGNLANALELVREARVAGADCVKFQTFRADRVVTRAAPKAEYQLRVTDPAQSQYAMLKALELSEEAHQELIETCRTEGVTFLSTPYSVEDAEMLARLGTPAFKIASGQIVELAFLDAVARMGVPLILSTGMSTLAEVDRAVATIRKTGNEDIIVLQCTTNYPSRVEDANLRVMDTMARTFGCVVGYSDHTEGMTVAYASIALGAAVLEKHFTLDRGQPGPDHATSVIPSELAELVRGIRQIEAALGSGVKQPTEAEQRNAAGMRRSIAAAMDIPAGIQLTPDMLTLKRPGTGLSPAVLDDVLGKTTVVPIPVDTLLRTDQLAG